MTSDESSALAGTGAVYWLGIREYKQASKIMKKCEHERNNCCKRAYTLEYSKHIIITIHRCCCRCCDAADDGVDDAHDVYTKHIYTYEPGTYWNVLFITLQHACITKDTFVVDSVRFPIPQCSSSTTTTTRNHICNRRSLCARPDVLLNVCSANRNHMVNDDGVWSFFAPHKIGAMKYALDNISHTFPREL